MKTRVLLIVAPFVAAAAWADPATTALPDSDVQARLDRIEKIVVTADKRAADDEAITDERIAAILEEAAALEAAGD